MITALLFLFIYSSICAEPTWTTYSPNVMYAGEYKAFLTAKTTGLLATVTQTMYRGEVLAAEYFTTAPRVILSTLGYQQSAPANTETFVGFDVVLSTITTTNFQVIHNIYGSGMSYLNYMYLAVSSANTDFFVGEYTQVVDQNSATKSYAYDIAVNGNETYPNYPTNTIEMKGFLAGYVMKQSTSPGFQLNFTLSSKNASYFTIQVSININSVLDKINFYRIGYDRTEIERRTNRDVFRDFEFELINNVNVKSIYNVSWGSLTEFQYRNFLMGTNKISITGTAPIAVEFYLYYYFAESRSKVDNVTLPYYISNPAIAKYLYGEVFYHAIASCTAAAPNIYYLPADRKCYSSCPTFGYFTDASSNTCVSCHYTCRTCSAGYLSNKCLSCDTNYRVFDSSISKCDCPAQTYDDLTNLECPSCHASCLTCTSSASTECKSCDSSLNRELSDSNNDGVGECVCKSTFYEDSNTGQCQSCSAGCQTCSLLSGTQVCSKCDSTNHWTLINGICVCEQGSNLINGVCTFEKCGNGILTQSQQCDDNNIIDRDGCSSSCSIEPQHVCLQDSNISPYSLCYFNGTILMTITDVTKALSSNEVSLTIKIDTSSNVNQAFLTNYLTSAPSIVIEDIPARLLCQSRRNLASSNTLITFVSYDSTNNNLQVTFSYNSSFDITKKKVRFQPSLSNTNQAVKYFYNSPEAIIGLEKTHNKIDTTYYDFSDYQTANSLKYGFLALLIMFWIMSLTMVVIGKGNVGMEMMIVYQIAYVSLLSQELLEISFAGLLEYGKYTAGYNVEMFADHKKCLNFAAINLGCNLFNNLNISFFLMVLIAVVFWCLKLLNKILNDRAQKEFLENRNKRYLQENNERTQEIIAPNTGILDKLSDFHFRSVQSESIRKIEDNYYKDQEFIPKRVYNILLDFEYLLSFVTVITWAMGTYVIKQASIQGIVQVICMVVFYIGVWIFWFLKYFKQDFSFIKAHKKTQNIYQEEQGQSVQDENQQQSQVHKKPVQRMKKSSRFSASFLKVLIYPLVWLSLVGLGLALAISQPVGYISQSLIIAGSVGFLLLNIFTQMYQQKLHRIRSALNCIFLVLIQGSYILSQSDSIVGFGLPITITIFVLLSIVVLSNSAATLYLYRLQVNLLRKKKQSRQVQKIQKQINKLETLKRTKQLQNATPFLKINDLIRINDMKSKSSQHSSSKIQKTVKKDLQYNFNFNSNYSPTKTIQQQLKPKRQIVHQIIDENKIVLSESYVPAYKMQNDSINQNLGSHTEIKLYKEKSFNQEKFSNFTQTKPKHRTRIIQHYLKNKGNYQ